MASRHAHRGWTPINSSQKTPHSQSIYSFSAQLPDSPIESSSAASSDLDPSFKTIPGGGAAAIHAPFSYTQALRNRLDGNLLSRGGKLEVSVFTPIFVYDILQIPGSLASAFGYPSANSVYPKMTPGKLYGFAAGVQRETREPVLLDDKPFDCVSGMVVFGRGARNRRALDRFYGAEYKKEWAVVEVVLRDGRRKKMRAYAWVLKDSKLVGDCLPTWETQWNIEDYIAGKYEPLEDGWEGEQTAKSMGGGIEDGSVLDRERTSTTTSELEVE